LKANFIKNKNFNNNALIVNIIFIIIEGELY